jgi:RNA polymerase sigma-70 factor (ECF subfamily)
MIVFWTVAPAAPGGEARPASGVDVAALFDAHGAFVLRSLTRLVPDESVAEDIAQEVFLIAHRRRHELDAERNVPAWLYRVAVNVAWRHRRTFARRAQLRDRAAVEPAPPASGDPERVVADREHARRVRACLQQLPREQREVFVLFELEEKSGDEVAALLGIPVATVWTRLHRARARMRQAWSSTGTADA